MKSSRKTVVYVGALCILSACQPMVDGAVTFTGYMQESGEKAYTALVDAFEYTPKVETLPAALPARYCYHTDSDIVCYNQPKRGARGPLSGVQSGGASAASGNGGYSVYQSVPVDHVSQADAAPNVSVPEAPEPLMMRGL